jgi:hypothetical protein
MISLDFDIELTKWREMEFDLDRGSAIGTSYLGWTRVLEQISSLHTTVVDNSRC